MYKSKVLIGLVVLLYLLSILFQFGGESVIANYIGAFILPVVALLYFLTVKSKTLFFSFFLILYSLSNLLEFLEPYVLNYVFYYLGNSLYILAYLFLLLEACKSVSVIQVIRNFKIHLLVLIILNIYIVYVLQVIVNPVVAKTNQYYVELVYNITMLTFLSVTLLNYFYKDNVKSLYLFLGALSIVFAEVIWVAYTYISEKFLLNVISTSLYVLSYYFFYKQSKLLYEDRQEEDMLID